MAAPARAKTRTVPDAQTRILVLHGPEAMLKRQALTGLRRALEAEHHDVDLLSFDGKLCELADVFDELRSFGLMQQYKIVVVDEGDDFVTEHRAALQRYAQNPVDHATLVLQCTRWYAGNLDKLIAPVGCIVKCEPLTAAKLKPLLIDRAREEYQRILHPRAAQLLIDRIGTDLMRLENELEKLVVLVDEGKSIEPELIDQVVGRSSDEQAWAVQEAVLEAMAASPGRPAPPSSAGAPDISPGGGGSAIVKLHELVDLSRQPDVLVAYFVADLCRKLHQGLMMKRQGATDQQITSQMKMWGARQKTFTAVLGRMTERTSGRLFDRIVDYDARAKSGFGQMMRNIECFCAGLDDELK